MAWIDIEKKENGLSIRNKINTLGEDTYTTFDNMYQLQSYHAFCTNANTDSLDVAFGKTNEDMVSTLGLQLAMYAWFKGANKTTYLFTNLKTCKTLSECLSNSYALAEILSNDNLIVLFNSSPYALSFLNETNMSKGLSLMLGLSEMSTYTSIFSSKTNATLAFANASFRKCIDTFSFLMLKMYTLPYALWGLCGNISYCAPYIADSRIQTYASTIMSTLATGISIGIFTSQSVSRSYVGLNYTNPFKGYTYITEFVSNSTGGTESVYHGADTNKTSVIYSVVTNLSWTAVNKLCLYGMILIGNASNSAYSGTNYVRVE